MNIPTLRAHFDGRQIVLDEPFELEPEHKADRHYCAK